MKILKPLKPILLFFTLISLFACSTDDDTTDIVTNADLIGEWQRNDANDQFVYSLTFEANEIGFKTEFESNEDGQQISSAKIFNWTTNNRMLTINYDNESLTTTYTLNAEGELLLSGISDLLFTKMD